MSRCLRERLEALQHLLDEAELWMHPGPFNEEPLSEVWKKGKLQSGKPLGLRRCVADVAAKSGGDTAKAFAICTASLQKAGVLKPGTQKLSKKGRKRTSKKYGQEKDIKAKDTAYERLLKAARKG